MAPKRRKKTSKKRVVGSRVKKRGLAKYKTAAAKKKRNKRRYDRQYLILLNNIRLRDRYECALCNAKNVRLEVHHIRKYSTHKTIRRNPLNLICVCRHCHDNTLKNREVKFQGLLSRKAKYNTQRFKKYPLTYEEVLQLYAGKLLIPEDFVPFEYKKADEIQIKKVAEHYISKLYRGISHRCYNAKNKSYDTYGGRGIQMYGPWKEDRKLFISWIMENLGERPPNHSLDRIETDGNYEPGNLRWASAETQGRNRRTTTVEDHVVLVAFILYHKYKVTQSSIMYMFNLNSPSIIRNIVKFKTFKELTIKYQPIVQERAVNVAMNEYKEKCI